jgi:hypothetical protein
MRSVPDICIQGDQIAEWNADIPSRVVHQDVQATEFSNNFTHACLYVGRIALVELNCAASPTYRMDGIDGRGGTIGAPDVGETHVDACHRQRFFYCTADVSRAASNKCDFAFEIMTRTSFGSQKKPSANSMDWSRGRPRIPPEAFRKVVKRLMATKQNHRAGGHSSSHSLVTA